MAAGSGGNGACCPVGSRAARRPGWRPWVARWPPTAGTVSPGEGCEVGVVSVDDDRLDELVAVIARLATGELTARL